MVDRSPLVVVEVPLGTIEQHPDNPRNGDVDAISESMSVNGVYQPIIVQTSTRYILVGNHRYVAALEAGMDTMPVIFRDVSDHEARRIMLADNRTSELGRTDEGLVAAMLEQAYRSDLGFLGTGYDMDDLQGMLDAVSTPMAPDEIPTDEGAEIIERLHDIDSDRLADKRELRYGLNPTISEDGRAYALTLTKASGKAISLVDVNMIRKALGMEPMQQDELDRAGVPAWRRK